MKRLVLFVLFMGYTLSMVAQTNPAPFVIANGEFKFLGFDDINISEYPPSMQGWAGVQKSAPQQGMAPVDVQATADIGLTPTDGANDLPKVMANRGDKGISMRSGTVATDPLALCVALNTVGAKKISVRWTGIPIHAYVNVVSGTQLQYRIGTSGNWVNLPNNEFIMSPDKAPAGQTQGPAEQFGPTELPAECEGKEVVQLRWLSYYVSAALNGTSNRGSIDSIIIKAGEATQQLPVADFKADKQLYEIGEVASFTDLTSGSPTSWLWDFGDSTTSTLQNPTHTYGKAGTFSVSLISNNATGSDTTVKADFITVADIGGSVEQITIRKISTFPSPGSQFIFVKGYNGNYSNVVADIFDLKGSKVMSKPLNVDNRIDISALERGIYTLQISNGSSTEVWQTKVVIQ